MIDKYIIEFVASFLIYILFVSLAVLWVIDGKIKREQVVHAIVAVLIAALTATIIKQLFPTVRPYVINGQAIDVIVKPLDAAFPSGHTAESFALAVTIFMHDRKIGSIYLILALAIGISRVLANVHYPIDILGGAFFGTLIAVLVERLHFMDLINIISGRKRRG